MAGNRYSVGGRSATTSATANHCAAALWNPSSTKKIYVREIYLFKTAATADHQALARITTRGTPGSTVTPDGDNSWDQNGSPSSGALLDLAAYSVQPTVASPYLARANLAAAIGAGVMWSFLDQPITVPPGTGLAIVTPVATAMQAADITFIWDE